MAFTKHGVAMPAKMVNLSPMVSAPSIGVGARVKVGGRIGTVTSVAEAKAVVVLDGDSTEVESSLSSLVKV
jgi:preprotein translocase subunit YajC